MLNPMPGPFGLFPEHLLVQRHHDHVVKVVAEARVGQHPNDIGEVIELMLGKEFVVQIETAEHHVDLRHVVVVVAVERVVQDGDVRPRRIQQPQVLNAASAKDVRKQAMKEFEIALAIEDHHRNLVTLAGRSDGANEILRDDVAQQRRLAGARLAENDPLHDADAVRPKPGIPERVVSKNNGVLVPRVFEIPAITRPRNPARCPLLLCSPALREQMPYKEVGKAES